LVGPCARRSRGPARALSRVASPAGRADGDRGPAPPRERRALASERAPRRRVTRWLLTMTGTLPDAPDRSATRILGDTAYLLEVSEEAERRIGRALELLSVGVPYERCVLFEARPGRPQRLVVVPDISREERGILAARAVRLLALLADHHERGLPPEQHAAPGSAGARLAVPPAPWASPPWPRPLAKAGSASTKAARAIASIERNPRLQVRLIEDLLDVARIASGKFSLAVGPADLATVVREAVEDAEPDAEAKRLGLQLMTIGRGEFLVRGDPARLRQ